MDPVLEIICLGLGFFLHYLWDKNSKQESEGPHGWSEEKNYPSETISSRDRNKTTVCEGGEISKTPHGWSEEINSPLKFIMTDVVPWMNYCLSSRQELVTLICGILIHNL